MDVSLRPAAEQDREFLYALHCSTMRDSIEQTWGWDDAWQRVNFEQRLASYAVSIIEADSRPVGSLWLEFKPGELYIHDLEVAPPHQGKGIGATVVKMVIEQGARQGLPVVLSVLSVNPRARALYERLGFRATAIEPPFVRMRRDA
jgi:ribosomal protein S18 acetylase RimI-like enzyme